MGEFKVGDVVKLRSGGPPMTVLLPGAIHPETKIAVVACIWADEHGVVHEHAIPVDCLVKF